MPGKHIVGLGGGGFSMESSPVLDDYILGLARSERPRICFVPTASGDNENYIVRFYRRFTGASCQPTHLELFRRSVRDLAAFALSQDVLYAFRRRCPAPDRELETIGACVPSGTSWR